MILVVLALFGGSVECAKKSSSGPSPVKSAAAPAAAAAEDSSVIEEVTAKQLERLLQDKDYVAVYWCKCYPI